MRYRAPRYLLGHPGVLRCTDAAESCLGEYRHDVELKPGWQFTNGRLAGCKAGFFNNRADWKYANAKEMN